MLIGFAYLCLSDNLCAAGVPGDTGYTIEQWLCHRDEPKIHRY